MGLHLAWGNLRQDHMARVKKALSIRPQTLTQMKDYLPLVTIGAMALSLVLKAAVTAG